ncbi:S24 family peptidase [Orbaceae bacterium ESL0721]|nr:S24 family peptidase [Orbaceae bacterium ESL0721]
MEKNPNVETFKDRLLYSIGDSSVSAFAKKCDMSETVIRDYLSGKTYPSLSRLQTIAENCGISYNWLATGYKLETLGQKEDDSTFCEAIHRISVYKKQLPTKEEAKTQQFVRDMPPVMNYPVIDGWVKSRGFNVNDLIIYWVKGDLMAPEIKNNSGVIINTDKRDIVDGAIYLIESAKGSFIRRIRFTTNGWVFLCNNDYYPAIEVDEKDFNKYTIVGRVVQIIQDVM